MKYIVNASEMKRYDKNTIEQIGLSQAVLMERAALAVAERITVYLSENKKSNAKVLIMCGTGNNGGDGIAAARILAEKGIFVDVFICGNPEKASEGFLNEYRIAAHYNIAFKDVVTDEYSVIVDAIFGVGLSRDVQGVYADAIHQFNQFTGYKIAVDIPSGIDADTGRICGVACTVDETITFAYLKKGLAVYPGRSLAGKVSVADIGISFHTTKDDTPGLFCYEENEVSMPARKQDGNKGTFGKVLLIAGSYRMAGAAILASTAAFRAGAGMVKILSCEENRVILQTSVPEAMLGSYDEFENGEQWADVIAVGPGLSKSPDAKEILTRAICDSELPLLIDADGLNLLSEDDELRKKLILSSEKGRTVVITPHVGELSRLTKHTIKEIQQDLHQHAKQLAMELQCVVAAKDATTIICRPEGPDCMNLTGNSGLATAGSGDVLAGMIAALLGQGMDAFAAASTGCYLHGKIAEMVSAKIGEHACMAGDVASYNEKFSE